jgi:hypothetical protein
MHPFDLPLDNMTVAEKMQLLEFVWSDLCRKSGDVRSPEWHAEILRQRQQKIDSGEMQVSSWSDAKERLLKLGK